MCRCCASRQSCHIPVFDRISKKTVTMKRQTKKISLFGTAQPPDQSDIAVMGRTAHSAAAQATEVADLYMLHTPLPNPPTQSGVIPRFSACSGNLSSPLIMVGSSHKGTSI